MKAIDGYFSEGSALGRKGCKARLCDDAADYQNKIEGC